MHRIGEANKCWRSNGHGPCFWVSSSSCPVSCPVPCYKVFPGNEAIRACGFLLFLQSFFTLLFCSSLVFLRVRPLSLPSRFSVTEPSLFSLLCSLFPLLSLLLFSQIPLRDCHFDLCMRPSTARQTASSFGDTWFYRFSLRSSLVFLRARIVSLLPALLSTNHLSSLFSLLFSLFSRCCFFPRSHFATVTSICASGHRWRATLLRPVATPRSSSRRGFLI